MKINKSIIKTHPILSILNKILINLPTPSNISFFWNFGSLLGLCLIIQIVSGLFLAIHYTPHIEIAFHSINHIIRDVNYGWNMRFTHINGASFFFIIIYIHILRNIYYESFIFSNTWTIGVIILLLLIITAFLGYILPWGQISYWGATVITNLLRAIPYMGNILTQWIWGGFTINNATLNRFFTLHFILPFILLILVLIHLIFLHETGRRNPLNSPINIDKIPFNPFFTTKDLLGFLIFFLIFNIIIFLTPNFLGDSDNFIITNPLKTPEHIQPEWYFLFAYAILRSIPNKFGGVIALVLSITILLIIPLTFNKKIKSTSYYYLNKYYFWILINILILLTWIGINPIETPYILTGQILTFFYFSYYLLSPLIRKFWEKLILN